MTRSQDRLLAQWRAEPIRESKFRSYVRLAKLDVFDYYLSLFVVLAAILATTTQFSVEVFPMLLCFVAGEICVLASLVAFDDYTGFADGSDVANYGPDAPLRRKLRKPLVAGTLTPAEALRFAWGAAAAGAALWTAAILIGPYRPMWTVILLVVTFVVSLQYSYGIKLSYHGFQEIYLAALGWVLVLAPYALATGTINAFVVVQALIFGLGPLLFGVYSNTNDIEGDRSVGRTTVASTVSPRANARFVAALSLAEFAIGAVGSLTGAAPWWFVLAMAPATMMRARQWHRGFKLGDIMTARRMGFRVHRLSVLLLVLANLLVLALG
ncbi:UbiA family prenyltransferase [Amycolatopsis albispora]|uniref:1,4-dihydroxy-2-naphthoate prenyltransferase n=1 Tax=Amycolatopsis albispora TaxID=1804986 RepID=A0A344LIX9_9PSEU|nr:UbiA family prenyltransferase [Amycolatopsis albispora]AXB48003.1 1,4-dihydroxy-2-naphthoate prenyltransferase [Amycolatopsis albispora]